MNAYRRHNPAKCRFRSRTEYRCKCPRWVEGVKDSRRIREGLKLRDWNRAQELVREWDVEGKKPKRKYRATIEEWRDQFLQDAAARHLTEATLRLYKLLFKQLIEFALEHGIKCADELDLKALTEFRVGWKIGPLTASKRLERLRSLYKFAMQRKMVEENFALSLAAPKVRLNPTLPFPKDEMEKILKAAESDKVNKRVKTFILTMRYAGLRISDVATLTVDNLKGNRLKLYQAKTGEPVSVLLPPAHCRCFAFRGAGESEIFFLERHFKTSHSYGDLARAHCSGDLDSESRWVSAPIPRYLCGRAARRRSQHRNKSAFYSATRAFG